MQEKESIVKCKVRTDKSVPQVTDWHQLTESGDAKKIVRTSNSCQILTVHPMRQPAYSPLGLADIPAVVVQLQASENIKNSKFPKIMCLFWACLL